MKVLIIDDSATQRLIIKSIIANFSTKLEIEEFTDGTKALAYLETNNVKLVFSDINMEPMTGIQLREAVIEKGIDSIFSFITSHLTDSMKETANSLGVKYYVTKPITQDKIEEILKEVFNDKL
jgi:YesN/AraC family two-component response regulator